jgi:hypothetical protein
VRGKFIYKFFYRALNSLQQHNFTDKKLRFLCNSPKNKGRDGRLAHASDNFYFFENLHINEWNFWPETMFYRIIRIFLKKLQVSHASSRWRSI